MSRMDSPLNVYELFLEMIFPSRHVTPPPPPPKNNPNNPIRSQ